MGIGTRRDPLDANAWYVKAADQGDERAKHRLAAIHSAASGGGEGTQTSPSGKGSSKMVDVVGSPASKATKGDENSKDGVVSKDGGEPKEKSKKKWGIF